MVSSTGNSARLFEIHERRGYVVDRLHSGRNVVGKTVVPRHVDVQPIGKDSSAHSNAQPSGHRQHRLALRSERVGTRVFGVGAFVLVRPHDVLSFLDRKSLWIISFPMLAMRRWICFVAFCISIRINVSLQKKDFDMASWFRKC